MNIIAEKTVGGKKLQREFSPFAWKLLGNNTNGWVQINKIESAKEVKSIPLPPKGETSAEEVFPPKPIAQPVIESDSIPQNVKDEFFAEVNQISKPLVKDYFDKINHTYKNNASVKALREELAIVMNYSIDALKKAF